MDPHVGGLVRARDAADEDPAYTGHEGISGVGAGCEVQLSLPSGQRTVALHAGFDPDVGWVPRVHGGELFPVVGDIFHGPPGASR